MKQVLQSLRTGVTEVADVPCPAIKPGHVLVRTRQSDLPGTERMVLEFSREPVAEGPPSAERVRADRQDSLLTDCFPRSKPSQGGSISRSAPGYCNVGMVIGIGEGVSSFSLGDRVVSNGPHAQVVCVPKNLCANIPEGVTDEAAAMTVLGAVALQGLRLTEPTLGESFAVIGLGLVGLLTVQLLRAQGCRVLGIDFDSERLKLAEHWGAQIVDLSTGVDAVAAAESFSRGRGVDGVCIAAATSSNEPVAQAARMCRKRGRIVLVGVAGLELSRADFYQKELSFRVSSSYGPGRYDREYEELGHDYPAGFVRWTAQRNFEAVLDLLAEDRLHVCDLITHRLKIEEADRAYDLLTSGGGSLGVLLEYPDDASNAAVEHARRTVNVVTGASRVPRNSTGHSAAPRIGFLGCGNFALRVLMPAFAKCGARLEACASTGGVSSWHAARKFHFAQATTDVESLIRNPDINAIVVATRHDSHARFVCQALAAGKHVFVEKPLALCREEIVQIAAAHSAARERDDRIVLMVGFNRRFAPHVQKIESLLKGIDEPKSFIFTVNAGSVPADHWTHDAQTGGGRIIGEACHHIDLLRHLCGHAAECVQAAKHGRRCSEQGDDKTTFMLRFADGSCGTVHYLANGHRSFRKSGEIFCSGRCSQLDNFRKLRIWLEGFRKLNLWRQNKGHQAEVAAFLNAVQAGHSSPVSVRGGSRSNAHQLRCGTGGPYR
jgi:predicted dehydrogenase